MQGIWNEPVSYFMFLRFTSQKYAQAFLTTGSIKFGTPSSWVDYAKQPGKRGDKKEGTLVSVAENESYNIAELNRLYGGDGAIVQHHEEGRILFKNKRHMGLPGFCFYMLKDKIQNDQMTQDVSGKMFTDFTLNQTEEEISKLPKGDRPAVILITQHNSFLDRLEAALMDIGVKKDEIFFDQIKYFDMDRGKVEGYKPLLELYCKDLSYSYQTEGRVIVNTTNLKVLKRLKKPIYLGNLSGIAKVNDWYFPNGMQAVVKADT